MGAFFATVFACCFMLGLMIFGMWGCPQYRVWQQGLAGEAAFMRAQQDRKIAVLEAQAKLESSTHLAAAEVERAKGVAESNRIIADGLGGAEGYLRYLWIQSLSDGHSETVYVPTEANLPILEATRRHSKPQP